MSDTKRMKFIVKNEIKATREQISFLSQQIEVLQERLSSLENLKRNYDHSIHLDQISQQAQVEIEEHSFVSAHEAIVEILRESSPLPLAEITERLRMRGFFVDNKNPRSSTHITLKRKEGRLFERVSREGREHSLWALKDESRRSIILEKKEDYEDL